MATPSLQFPAKDVLINHLKQHVIPVSKLETSTIIESIATAFANLKLENHQAVKLHVMEVMTNLDLTYLLSKPDFLSISKKFAEVIIRSATED